MAKAVAPALAELDGLALREMMAAATTWLEGQEAAVNALNVYPVPDGDTGTNMLLTMRDALNEAVRASTASASATANALAKGSLMGARGNSGVILSQILRGLARSFEGKERIGGLDLAEALQEGVDWAYKALNPPVEGTILTVIREVAEAARGQASKGDEGVLAVLEVASTTAQESVARTPSLLEVLRENGVVDAGGQGLAALLEGMVRHLKGWPVTPGAAGAAAMVPHAPALATKGPAASAHPRYGFCTEFFVEGCEIGVEELRSQMLSLGDSILVVGEQELVKVHLHTFDPDRALAYAGSLGVVARVKVDDIDEQHQVFLFRHAPLQGTVAVVAVVSGQGLASLFGSLGAAAIVPGGQGMNPSAQEILEAAMGLPAQEVIILPNNKNVIPAARQAAELAGGKELLILPTEDLPQGIAALMAFNYEEEAGANLSAMERSLRSVKTGEITRAVRRATVDGRRVEKGQAIGLTGGRLVVTAGDVPSALESLLHHVGVEDGSSVTLYHGAEVSATEAEEAVDRMLERFPNAEVQALAGGQPLYHYLLSVE